MSKTCFMCKKKMSWREDARSMVDYNTLLVDITPQGFSKKDVVCVSCFEEDMIKNHHKKIVETEKRRIPEDEFERIYKKDPLHIRIMDEYKRKNPQLESETVTSASTSNSLFSKINTSIKSSTESYSKQKVNVCFACEKVAYTKEHPVRELDKEITIELCEKCYTGIRHYQEALQKLRNFLKENPKFR